MLSIGSHSTVGERISLGHGGRDWATRADLELALLDAVEQSTRNADRDPVAQGVLGGPRLEAGGQPGQHRGMTERVPRTEQVEQAAIMDDVDRAE